MSDTAVEWAFGCERVRLGRVSDSSAHVAVSQRLGSCNPLAYRDVENLPSDGVRLVHGTLSNEETTIGHAWVVESDDWVWEPTNDAWFHSETAFAESELRGESTDSFTPGDARELREAGKPIGVWLPTANEEARGQPEGDD